MKEENLSFRILHSVKLPIEHGDGIKHFHTWEFMQMYVWGIPLLPPFAESWDVVMPNKGENFSEKVRNANKQTKYRIITNRKTRMTHRAENFPPNQNQSNLDWTTKGLERKTSRRNHKPTNKK